MKRLLPILLLFCSTSAVAQMKQFSADMVVTNKQETNEQGGGKLYVGAGKMRIDQGSGQPWSIIDLKTYAMYAVMPTEKMYMYMESKNTKGGMKQSVAVFFVPDPNDPCAEWKKLALSAEGKKATTGVTCKKVGTESLNGRSAEKWELGGTQGGNREYMYMWFDPQLGFFLKFDDKEETRELRNIKEGPQPASLFNIPRIIAR